MKILATKREKKSETRFHVEQATSAENRAKGVQFGYWFNKKDSERFKGDETIAIWKIKKTKPKIGQELADHLEDVWTNGAE